jgi:sirohydrochlorin cobaltochelatase
MIPPGDSDSMAILLVGHGTRSTPGQAEFLTLAGLLQREYSDVPVMPAFLELCAPTIADAIGQLRGQGISRLVVAPLLLFEAGHAKRDIPGAVWSACRDGLEVNLLQAAALECDVHLLKLSRLHFERATEDFSTPGQTLLLLVGRGSRDEPATQKMWEFKACRAEQGGATEVRVAFMAMAAPAIREALTQAASEGWPRIVIQPHLLFQGELLEELKRLVEEFAHRHPRQRWRLVAHLAAGIGSGGDADALLPAAVRTRIAAVMNQCNDIEMDDGRA